jgi:hypothetical protein
VRCESRLLDPADDEHVSLELHLHCVRLKDNGFSWVVSLDTARRLRDQLTKHLDAAQSTEADCPALSVVSLLPTPQLRTAAFLAVLRTEVTRRSGKGPGTMTVTICLPATEVISIDAMA